MTFARNNETWSGLGEELEYDYHFLTRTCLLAGFLSVSSTKYYHFAKSDICHLLSWFVLDIGAISNQYLTTCPPHQKKNPSKFQSNFLTLNFWPSLASISICDQYLTCHSVLGANSCQYCRSLVYIDHLQNISKVIFAFYCLDLCWILDQFPTNIWPPVLHINMRIFQYFNLKFWFWISGWV